MTNTKYHESDNINSLLLIAQRRNFQSSNNKYFQQLFWKCNQKDK